MRETLSSISEMTPAQAAISFVLQHSPVASCIVGTTSISNLREALCASDKRLSAESGYAICSTFQAQQIMLSK
jgi:aryl-alcohol dehydrogenase-like predicted oxidoreductase